MFDFRSPVLRGRDAGAAGRAPRKGRAATGWRPDEGRGRLGHVPGRLWPWPRRPGMRGVEGPCRKAGDVTKTAGTSPFLPSSSSRPITQAFAVERKSVYVRVKRHRRRSGAAESGRTITEVWTSSRPVTSSLKDLHVNSDGRRRPESGPHPARDAADPPRNKPSGPRRGGDVKFSRSTTRPIHLALARCGFLISRACSRGLSRR
jgi:hypothetical protein